MKLTFEGSSYGAIRAEMLRFLSTVEGVDIPEYLKKSVEKQEKEAQPAKLEADKQQVAERMAKARAARKPKAAPVQASAETGTAPENFEDIQLPPDPAPKPAPVDPTRLAAIRIETTKDLQAAYANGKHEQVLELLKKYGNGAKSFRELQLQDFVPIRQAIDDGALL